MEIFPEIDLFPRLTRAGNFIKRIVSLYPDGAPDYMSEHNRGAAPMIDDALLPLDAPASLTPSIPLPLEGGWGNDAA
jgi:hypothetical protein